MHHDFHRINQLAVSGASKARAAEEGGDYTADSGLDVLRGQSVEVRRVACAGGSRGDELALLL